MGKNEIQEKWVKRRENTHVVNFWHCLRQRMCFPCVGVARCGTATTLIHISAPAISEAVSRRSHIDTEHPQLRTTQKCLRPLI